MRLQVIEEVEGRTRITRSEPTTEVTWDAGNRADYVNDEGRTVRLDGVRPWLGERLRVVEEPVTAYVEYNDDVFKDGREPVHSAIIVAEDGEQFILAFNSHDPDGVYKTAARAAASLNIDLRDADDA